MKVFLSWSGALSRSAAEGLRTWIEEVLPGTEAWMSAHDVKPGSPWGSELHDRLAASDFGIVCLTKENAASAWVHYEAGSLVQHVKPGRLIPYLLDLEADAVSGPLSQFQSVRATQEGTRNLLGSLNGALTNPLPADALEARFQEHWPALEGLFGLTLRVHFLEGYAVVTVGPNAEDAFHRLPKRVDQLLQEGAAGALIDLAEISFLNSLGLAHLVRPVMAARKNEKPIAFVGAQPGIARMFQILGLETVLSCFPTAEAAIASFREAAPKEAPPEPSP